MSATSVEVNDHSFVLVPPTKSFDPTSDVATEHVLKLSSVEHCMPRAYIRICLAYRIPKEVVLQEVLGRLNHFVRRTINAKPYLAGYVVPVQSQNPRVGEVEVRFTTRDFLEFQPPRVRYFTHEELPYTYDDLDRMALPPSIIRPDLVSALTEGADNDRAPAFRIQANVIQGGIIISIYLHHCISDGTGLGQLITGQIMHDELTFDPQFKNKAYSIQDLSARLAEYIQNKSNLRQNLSSSSSTHLNSRKILYKQVPLKNSIIPGPSGRGRGCVVTIANSKLEILKSKLCSRSLNKFMSMNDVLQTLLWHFMTKARTPSLKTGSPTTSKLLIPINIRNKLKPKLSENYFGAAIDFVSVESSLKHLNKFDYESLSKTAMKVRKAIESVDDVYIRQVISLARSSDPTMDVRDLLASNMNRSTGADMYITSWQKLKAYDATLDLGIGQPDWVRKPWSRDPGSCIVLPRDVRKPWVEVVVQMTESDMARLLADSEFRHYVLRITE